MAKQLNKSVAGGNSIKFNVGFTTNKSDLNEVKNILTELQKMTNSEIMDLNQGMNLQEADAKLKEIRQTATTLKQTFQNSFNEDLGSVNLTKFNSELNKSGLNLKQIASTFSAAGSKGEAAFRNITTEVLTTNRQMKETHHVLQDMANTMANTIKWGVASSAMNSFTGSVQSAYSFVKKLDTSLNNIMIVSNKSADDMERFAKQANSAAQALGAQTTAYTDAALIYYQQGLKDDEVEARAETTIKAANVTGMSGSETSEALTAVWNGYKVSAAETEEYVDKLAAVAAGTAADLEELSTGMSKVASAANVAGVDVDQLNATLATVISVTREAPETIGTAFKTIYARLGDLALDGQDEYGVTLGTVSGQMEELGIQVLDEQGNMRDMGDIIEDTAEKWGTWTQAQKQAAAVAMAGKMQYSRLMTLFENWDMYEDALSMSENSLGTLQEQQDTYMESTEAHLSTMTAAFEGLYSAVLDPKAINGATDGITFLVNRVTDLVDGIGGGSGVLLNFGSIATKVFSQNIASGLATTITNIKSANENLDKTRAELQLIDQFKDIGIADSGYKQILKMKEELLQYSDALTTEEENEANESIRRYNEILKEKDAITDAQKAATQYLDVLEQQGEVGIGASDSFSRDENGNASIDFKNEDKDSKFGDLTDDLENYRTALNNQIDEINKVKKSIKEYKQDLTSMNNIYDKATSKTEEETNAQEELRTSLDKVEKETRKLTKDQRLSIEQQDELKKSVEAYMKAVNGKEIDPTVATNLGEDLVKAYEKAISQIEVRTKQAQKTIEDSANGVGQNAYQNAKKASDAWDGSMKKIQLEAQIKSVTNFVGSLGQIASAISNVSSMIDIFNDKDMSGGEKALKILESITMTIPMLISGVSGVISDLPKLAAAFVPTFASMAVSEQTVGAAATAMWTEVLWPIAPIIAALAAVGVAIYALVKWWNSDADAAKEAQAAAKDAKVAAEEASEAYNTLLETLESYKDAKDGLDDLKEGTEEYKEKLEETNDAALELIAANEELAKYATKKNGVITFVDENGKELSDEDITAKTKARASEASGASKIAQIDSNEAQLKSQRTNFLREADLDASEKQLTAGVLSAISPSTALLTTAMVHLEDTLTDGELESVIAQIINDGGTSLIDAGGAQLRASLEQLSFLNDDEIDALMENSDKLKELVISTDNLNATNKLLLQESLEDSLENDSTYAGLSDEEKGAVSKLYGKGLTSEEKKKIEQEAKDKWYQDAAFGGGNEDTVHTEYAKARGWTLSDDKIGDKAVYVDENGDEQTISDDSARAYLVERDTNKNLKNYNTSSLKEIENAVQSIDAEEIGYKYGADFKTAILNTIANGGDKIDTSQLFADISPSEVAELNAMTGDQWKDALGLTDEELDTLGLGSGTELAEKFQEAFKNYDWDPTAAVKSSISKMEVSPEDLGLDEEEFAGYAEHLMDIADNSDDLADSLEEDSDSATILTKQIMRMNNGIDDLADGQEEWIDILKNSSRESQEYYDALSDMKKALADVLDTEEDYISETFVTEHLDDIQKAAEGDADAIDRLHKALATDMVVHIAVDNDLSEAEVQSLQDKIQNLEIPDIEVGTHLDYTEFNDDEKAFIDSLLEIVEQSKMTADEANEFFSQMGFEPNFETKKETITDEVPVTVTESEVMSVFPLKMRSKSYQDGTEPVKREIEVPMLSSSSKNSYKGVKGITKKATGSYNNYSSKNSGGKSAGSSGSGSSSSKTAQTKDLNEDKVDRYEKVNTQLDLISATLKKLQSQEEKLIGAKLIGNLNDQLKVLNSQIDKTKEKLQIAKGEQSELQSQLSGYGIGFDSDGVMTNYAQVFAQQQAALNAVYNHYNSLSADAQEGYESTVEAAEKKWEQFKDAVSNYDELIGSTIPGLEQDIQDTIDEEIEIKIKEFDMEIELTLDLKEAEDVWNDFREKVIDQIQDDDILGNAASKLVRGFSYYNDDNLGVIQEEVNYLNNLMGEIDKYNSTGWSDWYGDDENQMMEDLKTYYEQAMSDMEDFQDLVDEIHDALNETLEDVADQMEDQMTYYETISDTLEHDMKLVQLVYGEEAYGRLALYYQQQEKNLNAQLDFQRSQVDFWQTQMDTLEEGSDAWETAKENWLDAVSEWQSSVETAIENLQDKFANAINEIFQNLNDKITSGDGLDFIDTEWELINKNADQYLDTINATYGIQQLQNKYLDAIDNTDSISAQKKLNELMNEQVDALKEQDKLSQYDLDRADLKYQIAVKRIALEEAQQNKSTMRLKRDSQGNYSYQYVSDDDEIKDLQNELSDLYNQLYNLDTDQYTDNLDQLYEIWVEYQEKMAEAAQINDPEARLQKEQLLTEQYGTLINGIVEQNEGIKQNLYESTFLELEDLYGHESEVVQDFLANQDDAMEILITGWSSGLQQMADEIFKEGGFEATYEEALARIAEATEEYEGDLVELQETADVTFEDLGEDIDETQTEVQDLIEDTDTLNQKFQTEVDEIQNIITQIDNLKTKYQEQANSIQTVTDAYNKYITAMKAAQTAAANNANSGSGASTNGSSGSSSSGSGSSSAASSNPYSGYRLGGQTYTIQKGDTLWGIAKKKYGNGSLYTEIWAHNSGTLRSGNPNLIYPGEVIRLDTGGYTGSWGSKDGKMAMLHEKELVLNKQDTENILNTVEIMRNITNALGSSILRQFDNLTSNGFSLANGISGDTLEQDVHIEASFPNVSNSNEIESALNNLVNAAAQRINKR